MSVIPVVRQIRRDFRLSDNSVRFEVSNEVIDQGDLPFPHVFVMTIVDPGTAKEDVLARIATPVDIRRADPSAPLYVKVASTDITSISGDTFARIANTSDLTKLSRDRVTAVVQGATSYLSTAVSLIYDNYATADAAARQVVSRLSDLVTAWRTYNTAFATNPYQDYNLPQTAASVEAERTAVYVEKRTARETAETAYDNAVADKERCERDCAADKVIYDFLVADVTFLEQAKATVQAQINDVYPAGTFTVAPAILTPAGPFTVTIPTSRTRDYVLKAGTFSTDLTSYENLLVKKRQDLAIYSERVRACSATCARLAAAVLTAQQTLDAAQAAERAALANVVAVCPTFDPSTV
jgi:hypothetical protein